MPGVQGSAKESPGAKELSCLEVAESEVGVSELAPGESQSLKHEPGFAINIKTPGGDKELKVQLSGDSGKRWIQINNALIQGELPPIIYECDDNGNVCNNGELLPAYAQLFVIGEEEPLHVGSMNLCLATGVDVFALIRVVENIDWHRYSTEKLERVTRGLLSLDKLDHMKSLNLGDTDITDSGIEALVKRLPNLTSLDLGGTAITGAGIEALVEHLPNLTSLDLSGTGITDAGIEALVEHLPNLISLGLGSTAITGAGIEALVKGLPKLTSLGLGDTAITDAGIEALVLPSLTSLDLGGTAITDAGIKALVKCLPSLTSLDLDGTGITPQYAFELEEYFSERGLILYQPHKVTESSSVVFLGSGGGSAQALLGSQDSEPKCSI